MNRTMKKAIGKGIAVIIGLVVLVGISNSLVITQENEYKLIREFGRVNRVVSQAGISFKVPFIQSADTLPKEILLYDLASSP